MAGGETDPAHAGDGFHLGARSAHECDELARLLGSYWLAGRTCYYLLDERRFFVDAVRHLCWEVRYKLTFLPLVGAFFAPDEDRPEDE